MVALNESPMTDNRLLEQYGSINKLNYAWGSTNYESFDVIPLPDFHLKADIDDIRRQGHFDFTQVLSSRHPPCRYSKLVAVAKERYS